METIKTTIIKYLEGQGFASKSKIEDYIRLEIGTNGDTTSRRIRELVASDVLKKVQREYQGKKYWEYSVVEEVRIPTMAEVGYIPREDREPETRCGKPHNNARPDSECIECMVIALNL